MTLLATLVALVLAFLVFRFLTGMIKFGVLMLIVVPVAYFIAHQAGAF